VSSPPQAFPAGRGPRPSSPFDTVLEYCSVRCYRREVRSVFHATASSLWYALLYVISISLVGCTQIAWNKNAMSVVRPYVSPPKLLGSSARNRPIWSWDAACQSAWPFVVYTDLVRTSQETHCVFATKTNRLMLFREPVAVYCVNDRKHISTLCGRNAEFVILKQVVHIPTAGLKV
jgi:hypothetical protein